MFIWGSLSSLLLFDVDSCILLFSKFWACIRGDAFCVLTIY
jgi:hypothetical protein